MSNLSRPYTTPAPKRDTFNPYAHAARLRKQALALLTSPSAPSDPFAGIEDRTGLPVKDGRKTAGGAS